MSRLREIAKPIIFDKRRQLPAQNVILLPRKAHKESPRPTDFSCREVSKNLADTALGQFIFPAGNDFANGGVAVEIDFHSGACLFNDEEPIRI